MTDHALVVAIYRSIRVDENTAPGTKHMKIRVSLPSYKLVYERGSEEVMWRRRGGAEEAELRVRAQGREEERRKSIFLD